MKNTVIKVEEVSKLYRLGKVGTGTISHDLNRWWSMLRGKEDPFLKIGSVNDRTTKGSSDFAWALKDIDFEVKQGEVLGIIGKNGAGKSTLLKLLSRVTGPTTGSIKVKGRIASLLEVGTGFHPELSGRENIYLNGAILGMRKAEIKRKFDEIVEFAGVAKYIDTPVKRYSSGMYVRLAFAVAAHLESEIMVVDEVLAVGDAEFQKKCLGKMGDVAKNEGRTVLFVSHNMAAVQSLCTEALVLQNGMRAFLGAVQDGLRVYQNQSSSSSNSLKSNEFPLKSGLIYLNRLTLNKESPVHSNGKFEIEGEVLGSVGAEVPYLIVSINAISGYRVLLLSSRLEQVSVSAFKKRLSFAITLNDLSLMPNFYTLSVKILSLGGNLIAGWDDVCTFEILPPERLSGLTLPSEDQRGISCTTSIWKLDAE
jgi:lipopolysaccharide transport system ATP-binding protein